MSRGDVALRGDMGSVTAVARNFSRLDGMNEAMHFVASGLRHAQAAGNAQTLTSLRSACRPIQTHAQRIAAARTTAGAALSSYANEVSVLQQEARVLRAREEAALQRRDALSRSLGERVGDDAEAMTQTRRLQVLVEEVEAELLHLDRVLQEIDEARLQTDRRCVAVLEAQTVALHALASGGSAGSGGSAAGAAVSLASLVRVAVRASQSDEIDLALEAMASGTLTPEQVVTTWEGLGLTRKQVRALPIEDLFVLANIDGVPAWARDIASRAALRYAISHPDEAYALMEFEGTDLSTAEFTKQITALQASLKQTKSDAQRIVGTPKVQMLGFGNHDGALTTAISLGDLDAASHVAVNVPGMGSNVGKMDDALGAARNLFRSATEKESTADYAVVSWFGYRAPGAAVGGSGVWGMERANAGATNLVGFLDGVHAFRASESATALDRVVVLAHSYGSTTAAQALKRTAHDVDAFVTYGSAGLEAGTTLDDLHAGEVFSTKAPRDTVAGVGYAGNDRVDPLSIGAEEFDAEGGENAVSAHDMFTEDTSWNMWIPGGKIGYLASETSVVDFAGSVIAGVEP